MSSPQKSVFSLGELEAEVMEIVWQKKLISVKEVTTILQERRTIAYTTAMTVMGRLVEKGLLCRQTSGRAYLYKPTSTKEKFLAKVSRQIIQNLRQSFGEAAIAHFAEEVNKLTPAKKRKLANLIKRQHS